MNKPLQRCLSRTSHGLLLVCCLLGCGIAAAAERLVDPRHPNAQDAGSGAAGAPYKTLGYAMSRLKPGDHLIIAAGTYRDALVFPTKPWTRIPSAAIEADKIDATITVREQRPWTFGVAFSWAVVGLAHASMAGAAIHASTAYPPFDTKRPWIVGFATAVGLIALGWLAPTVI